MKMKMQGMEKAAWEMQRAAKAALEEMAPEQRAALKEFDREQKNADTCWRRHRDDRELEPLMESDSDEWKEDAQGYALDPDIHYRFPAQPTLKALTEELGEVEAHRRRDSWFQVSAKKPPPKYDQSLYMLNEIYTRSPDDLPELMSCGKVANAMRQLTDLQQKVLYLHYVQQYTVDEIAEMLGSSPRNIRQRRQDAISKIRKLCGYDPDQKR